MTNKQVRKYCDITLKGLISKKFKAPLYYAVGDPENTYKLDFDFFKAINIPNSDVDYIINVLLEYKFIYTETLQRSASYDQVLRERVEKKKHFIRIENEGRIFIKSTSFRYEHFKNTSLKWWPLYISIAGVILTIIFNLWPTDQKLKLERIEQKVQRLQKQFENSQNQNHHLGSLHEKDTL